MPAVRSFLLLVTTPPHLSVQHQLPTSELSVPIWCRKFPGSLQHENFRHSWKAGFRSSSALGSMAHPRLNRDLRQKFQADHLAHRNPQIAKMLHAYNHSSSEIKVQNRCKMPFKLLISLNLFPYWKQVLDGFEAHTNMFTVTSVPR